MTPYLLEIQAKTRVSLGKSIAQILSAHGPSTYPVLRWLSMDQGEEKAVALLYHEVEDEGEEGYFDPTDFTPLEEEEPYGLQTEFDTVEQAFAFAAQTYGASAEHYVPESRLEEEYARYFYRRTGLNTER